MDLLEEAEASALAAGKGRSHIVMPGGSIFAPGAASEAENAAQRRASLKKKGGPGGGGSVAEMMEKQERTSALKKSFKAHAHAEGQHAMAQHRLDDMEATEALVGSSRLHLLEGLFDNAEALQDQINAWSAQHAQQIGGENINVVMTHSLLKRLGLSQSKEASYEVFKELDKDGSGYISLKDLSGALWVSANKEMRRIEEKRSKVDVEQPARITPAMEGAADHLRDALVAQATRVIDLFQRWDVNGDGEITKEEFRKAIPELGLANGGFVDELFDSFDIDSSGAITFRELNRMLRRTKQGDDRRAARVKAAAENNTAVEVVDLKSLRQKVYKEVRTNAVHADIESQLNREDVSLKELLATPSPTMLREALEDGAEVAAPTALRPPSTTQGFGIIPQGA